MKKHILQNICLAPFGLFLRIVALLPLRILYILSDLLYPLVYYIGRYRLHIVRKNLKNAFPQNTPQERKAIERRFYRHFCDYFFETIKLLHISDDEMRRRMQFVNAELLESTLNSGRSVIMMLGHYGNWEYISSISLWINTPNTRLGQIYRPLKNEWFDRLFLKIRSVLPAYPKPVRCAPSCRYAHRANNREPDSFRIKRHHLPIYIIGQRSSTKILRYSPAEKLLPKNSTSPSCTSTSKS